VRRFRGGSLLRPKEETAENAESAEKEVFPGQKHSLAKEGRLLR